MPLDIKFNKEIVLDPTIISLVVNITNVGFLVTNTKRNFFLQLYRLLSLSWSMVKFGSFERVSILPFHINSCHVQPEKKRKRK